MPDSIQDVYPNGVAERRAIARQKEGKVKSKEEATDEGKSGKGTKASAKSKSK